MDLNLPNYFLADLPPEATLSAPMIAEAGTVLKKNREKFLLPRKTGELVDLLCEVGSAWLRPENHFRQLALECGPARTGFSKAVLAKGLDQFFRRFTPENFKSLLEQELGHAERLDRFINGGLACGPKLLVHIAAGNLPNPAMLSLTLGLLTRSAQFMKCASNASFMPRLFAHSIYELDHKLGSCLELAEWRGGMANLESALFSEADCVTATGSNETIASIRAQLPVKTRFIGYGQKVSFGLITREALREETVAQTVAQAADDVIAWDQNGCLSPHVFYVEERGLVESDVFAQKLAVELAQRESGEPRGAISVEESAAITSRRATYEALAAHRGDLKLWASSNSTAWTVVFEHDVRFRVSPLNRFIYVKPVPDLSAVMEGVDEIHGLVSTVGIAASPDKTAELALHFARWGAARICPLGQMQNPPLTWRHDGRSALGELVTWIDFE